MNAKILQCPIGEEFTFTGTQRNEMDVLNQSRGESHGSMGPVSGGEMKGLIWWVGFAEKVGFQF